MKLFLSSLFLTAALGAQAETLTCKINLVKDDPAIGRQINLKSEIHSIPIPGGIDCIEHVIDDYEKSNISYNYSVCVDKESIISVRAENEITLHGTGISGLKGQKEISFEFDDLFKSYLQINCSIK